MMEPWGQHLLASLLSLLLQIRGKNPSRHVSRVRAPKPNSLRSRQFLSRNNHPGGGGCQVLRGGQGGVDSPTAPFKKKRGDGGAQ